MIALPARYKVETVVPGGGMSDTLLCNDEHLDRKVIVKSLKPGIDSYRLMDELSALAAIRSRHVVQVLDIIKASDGSIIGFAEEYINGQPLIAAPLGATANDVMRLIYPIAAGISDIHEHNRVHRDIKPDNMRYDAEKTLKIFDFGLAKIDGSGGTGQLWYSKGYCAPEIFVPDSSGKYNFTKMVDVFAFGATACWIANGETLPLGLLSIPPSLPCVDFSAFACGLPKPVSDMLNQCLNPNPLNRPPISAVRDLLGKMLLVGKHRMLLTNGNDEYRLDAGNPKVSLSARGGNIQLAYNGIDFVVTAVSGPVLVNNMMIRIGDVLRGSTVIVFGLGPKTSVTADVSHPEVIL